VLTLVFGKEGKPDNLENKPSEQVEYQQQTLATYTYLLYFIFYQPTYGTGSESNPRHIAGRRALSGTTASSLLTKCFSHVIHATFIYLPKTFDDFNNNKQKKNKILLIANISNYISFPPQIAYKLIEAGRSKNILQIQGLSIDGLNNRENTTIQYIE